MTLGPGDVHIPSAHALLEAGEADSAMLVFAIARRVDELLAGEVLEVVSRARGASTDVVGWCRDGDHELVALLVDGSVTRFWIRKRGSTEPFSGDHTRTGR